MHRGFTHQPTIYMTSVCMAIEASAKLTLARQNMTHHGSRLSMTLVCMATEASSKQEISVCTAIF